MSTPKHQLALGAAVKARRTALGFSQEDFADKLGMHRTQLGHIEQGKKDCRLSTVIRLADALGLSASNLLRGADL
ncbi:helix-turn-helix domain-containing protein [Stenotrophomonas indicatrix]|uniref:helix-turn-helix domain-containing protein n=1 Tax=Stenotrophomonas indicatrix TaxID=2045451 RepID=UPI001070E724